MIWHYDFDKQKGDRFKVNTFNTSETMISLIHAGIN